MSIPVILLVEDDDQVRAFVRLLLTTDGYEVIEARAGAEALVKAAEAGKRIDVVVSDMLLPELSGYDVARKIKEANPSVKILLMTGYVEGEIVEKSVAELNAVFLDKPFTPARLRRAIRDLLNAERENARAASSDFHRKS